MNNENQSNDDNNTHHEIKEDNDKNSIDSNDNSEINTDENLTKESIEILIADEFKNQTQFCSDVKNGKNETKMIEYKDSRTIWDRNGDLFKFILAAIMLLCIMSMSVLVILLNPERAETILMYWLGIMSGIIGFYYTQDIIKKLQKKDVSDMKVVKGKDGSYVVVSKSNEDEND